MEVNIMSKFNINDQLKNDDDNSINVDVNNKINVDDNSNDFLVLKKQSRLKAKSKPIQFYLKDDLINKIDRLSKMTGQKRNDLVIELLEFAINKTKIVE
jgi:hypothetical protein